MPNTIKIKFEKTAGMVSYNNQFLPKFKDGEEKEVEPIEAHYLLGNFPKNFKSAGKNAPKHTEIKAANDHFAKMKKAQKPTNQSAEIKQRMKQLDKKEAELTEREEGIIETEEKLKVDYDTLMIGLGDIAVKMGIKPEFDKMMKGPEEDK